MIRSEADAVVALSRSEPAAVLTKTVRFIGLFSIQEF
jgi:hypothetical protein